MLPRGPEWRCKPWETAYPTKKPLHLYYRDPLECIQSILYHPLVKDFIKLSPFRLYESAAKTMRFYTEWLSGDVAWSMQVHFFFLYKIYFLIFNVIGPASRRRNPPWGYTLI